MEENWVFRLTLTTSNHSQIQINCTNYFVANVLSGVIKFLNQQNWLLEIELCLVKIPQFEVAVAQLVVAVNKHDRLVKYNLLWDAPFNSFELFNWLLGLAKFKQTLRHTRIHFDVLIGAKAKGFCRHVHILVFFVLISKLNPSVKQLAYLAVAG